MPVHATSRDETGEAAPPTFDTRHFRNVLGHYPSGVAVVTASDPAGAPVGMAVSSFTSVSLEPPLVAFFPDKSSTTWPRIRAAGAFCVNILDAAQEPVCRAMAVRGGDKFADVSWSRSVATGSPVISDAVAWIDCRLEAIHEAGDHYIVIGRVQELDTCGSRSPLLFYQGGYGRFSARTRASGDPDLLGQLRIVDLARAGMDSLASRLGVECLACAITGDELVLLASAGTPRHGTVATRVGQRVPLVPPLARVFYAWAPDEAVGEWLVRGGPLPVDERQQLLRSLAVVRERGYSVSLGKESHQAMETALTREPEPAGDAGTDELRRIVGMLGHEARVPQEDAARGPEEVRVVNAPVFGPTGTVVLELSLYELPFPLSEAALAEYVEGVTTLAASVTEQIGGRRPES